jgi:hypothetical protein
MKPQERHQNIRDTLFGDIPLDSIAIPEETLAVEPWASFAWAKQLTDSDDTRNASTTLQGVLHMPGLESRHYL